MSEEMKHDFYVPVVRQMALDKVPLRSGSSSQNFGKEPMFIFSIVRYDQRRPNKMIVVLDDFGISYEASKWPVSYDKCIRKSMSVTYIVASCKVTDILTRSTDDASI